MAAHGNKADSLAFSAIKDRWLRMETTGPIGSTVRMGVRTGQDRFHARRISAFKGGCEVRLTDFHGGSSTRTPYTKESEAPPRRSHGGADEGGQWPSIQTQ
eukprot:gene28880-32071_t